MPCGDTTLTCQRLLFYRRGSAEELWGFLPEGFLLLPACSLPGRQSQRVHAGERAMAPNEWPLRKAAAFRANKAVLEAFRSTVSDNRCLLLAWSAGTTCTGCSVEHSMDSVSQLTLRLNQRPCLRGLGLFPNYSFAPHRQRPEHDMLMRYLRRRQPLYYGNNSCLVLLPDGAMLVFCQSRDPIFWNSESIGWARMDDRL